MNLPKLPGRLNQPVPKALVLFVAAPLLLLGTVGTVAAALSVDDDPSAPQMPSPSAEPTDGVEPGPTMTTTTTAPPAIPATTTTVPIPTSVPPPLSSPPPPPPSPPGPPPVLTN